MKRKLSQNTLIDWERFGANLRLMRKQAGYDNAKQLVSALHEKTEFILSGRTYYKIERGEIAPTIECLVALSILFPREVFGDFFKCAFKGAARGHEFVLVTLRAPKKK